MKLPPLLPWVGKYTASFSSCRTGLFSISAQFPTLTVLLVSAISTCQGNGPWMFTVKQSQDRALLLRGNWLHSSCSLLSHLQGVSLNGNVLMGGCGKNNQSRVIHTNMDWNFTAFPPFCCHASQNTYLPLPVTLCTFRTLPVSSLVSNPHKVLRGWNGLKFFMTFFFF